MANYTKTYFIRERRGGDVETYAQKGWTMFVKKPLFLKDFFSLKKCVSSSYISENT